MERLILWHRTAAPERDGSDDIAARKRWADLVAAAFAEAGGTAVPVPGNAVVFEFDGAGLPGALSISLKLLDEAEQGELPMAVSIGMALGENSDGSATGGAFDRAALLAHHGGPGDLALDAAAAERANEMFLFGRPLPLGDATPWQGTTIDRLYPERSLCRPAVKELGAFAFPSDVPAEILRLREYATATGVTWVIVRGRPGSGTEEWVSALAATLSPPLVLWFPAVPGSLEPLGSLRLALLRQWAEPQAVHDALGGGAAAETLQRIATGEAVQRADAIKALQSLLAGYATDGARPWLVMSPFTALDPATREVVALATLRSPSDSLVLVQLAGDTPVPAALASAIAGDVMLPTLTAGQGKDIARHVLGKDTAQDIVDHVAVTGGDTPLGVLEAARTLVSSGDIVVASSGFVWRSEPRRGASAVAVSSLMADRLVGLDAVARRILEIVAAAPAGTSNDVLWELMKLDGIDADQCVDAVGRLRDAALLGGNNPLETTSASLHAVICESTAAPRLQALHEGLASVLMALAPSPSFISATRGHFLHEAGQKSEGARALIEAGKCASDAGFVRAAMRLAAAAVQFDPSPQARTGAAQINEATQVQRSAPPPPSQPPPPNRPVVNESELSGAHTLPPRSGRMELTIAALLEGNTEVADHNIDVAVADGANADAAERLRAMAHLVRGDSHAAMMALARGRTGALSDPRSLIRDDVARALVQLHSERPMDALRTGLRALWSARSLSDSSGERAAMHTIAAIAEAYGRSDDAVLIREMSKAKA